MQSLNLVGHQGGIYNQIELLKPKELLYVRIDSIKNTDEAQLMLIKKAARTSDQVYISIPADEFSDVACRDFFWSLGIKGFALRMKHEADKWLKYSGKGQFFSGNQDLVRKFEEYVREVPTNKELVVEFEMTSDLRALGPTITGVHLAGAKWVVLNVEGAPTRMMTSNFREMFEYLKIRAFTRLNIYFPFWNEYAGEWNIKTQNTFSGLEHVHIDISNRCTHSCVFCGLYGPAAIEDMKLRSGGAIPEKISNFMKSEIDSEKCFNIIESLPWTVKAIQFGGAGDPLMHESAVKFIAAARQRGFSVEVLSNMEYLDTDDINNLHALGGAKFLDLHFIANISAGEPQLYIQTRPKQTEKHFEKIISNLTMFSELRKKNNGNGVNFTLMCVVNKINCNSLLGVSELAHKIGASKIWFKPMEIHGKIHEQLIPDSKEMVAMAISLIEAMKYAEANKIEVFQKDYCEALIKQYLGSPAHV